MQATNNRKTKLRISIGLLLLLGVAVVLCILFFLVKDSYIPRWVTWNEKAMNDGRLVLKDKMLTLYDKQGNKIFSTERTVKVQDFLLTDIDGNGHKDIIALVWKRGNYGKYRPFWIDKDERNYSQHIFIYEIEDENKVRPKWFASETGHLIRRMKLEDESGKIILVEDVDKTNSLWRWEGFGLKNVDNSVRFIAFGDNIIHEEIYKHAYSNENGSFDFLYEPFKKEIENADIAAFQAETVLVDKKFMVSGYPTFGSPKEVGQALADAGFDIAVCANNHTLDKGRGAVDFTKDFYEDCGLKTVGIQKSTDKTYRPYELISRNGIKFALFAYTYDTNVEKATEKYPNLVHYLPQDEDGEKELVKDLTESRKEADIVVVFVHWGDEYQTEISSFQEHFAELFAEGNADVVIGTHPHVVQETKEIIRPDGNNTIVFYSLGNFRADQGFSEETKIGEEALFTAEHTYDGIRITGFETKEINTYWKDDVK